MSKSTKKIIPCFLILIILVGLFGPMAEGRAQGPRRREEAATAVNEISRINIQEAQGMHSVPIINRAEEGERSQRTSS